MNGRRILLTTDVVGGVWDFCVTLAGGLRAAGDDVVMLALGTPSMAQRHAACEAGAQLVSAPVKLEWMSGSEPDVDVTRNLVAQIARQIGADAVHANQFAAADVSLDVPVILTIHSDVLSWRRWTLGDSTVPSEWQCYATLARNAVMRADHVVAVSGFLADEIRRLYELERPIEVVHNGWPNPSPSDVPRERLTVVAGRVWDAAKNVSLIAEAAAGWNPGPVVLAGERVHPEGGRATVLSPLQPVGFLQRAELDALLARAKLYVSAARYDPFGLLPLQAALQGCALLLSDIPSYREMWAGAATFFRSNNADDLRRHWQCVLTGDAAQSAYARAIERFGVDRMVRDYRRLYATRRAVAA